MQVYQVRLLRRLLLGLIALVSLAVLVNYVQIWRRRRDIIKPTTQILSPELLRSATDVKYSATEKGVTKFKVSAKKLLTTREDKEFLEGIDANDFNPDGSERNHISSNMGWYDRVRKQAFFSGDVRLRLGRDIELRMETLYYSIGDQTGHSDDRLRLTSPQASGTAKGVRYDNARRRIELLSDLAFVVHRRAVGTKGSSILEEYQLTSQQGYYSEQEHLIRLQGAARIVSAAGSLAGDRIEATFSPDKKHLTSLASRGNAIYESADQDNVRTLRGEIITFGIGFESKALENIHLSGLASFSLKSPDGGQKLAGSQIHLTMDPVKGLPRVIQSQQGVRFEFKREVQGMEGGGDWLEAVFVPEGNILESMHIRDHASLKIGGGTAAPDELQAEDIRVAFRDLEGRSVPRELQAERTVQWRSPGRSAAEPGRSLSASSLTMRYSEKGDSLQSGTAGGGVTLNAIPKPGPGSLQVRRLQCDRVDFFFYPGNNRLQSMAGDGHVQVFYSRPAEAGTQGQPDEFHTSSSNIRAKFKEADGSAETITQSGGFVYQDGIRTAKSGTCDFSAATEKLVLSDGPSFTDPDSSTSGELMEYDRTGKILTVRRQVRSTLKSAAGNPQGFLTASSDASSSVIVTADEMQYRTEQAEARYTGNVHLLSADGQLQAQSLVIQNKGNRVEAEGNVRHLILRFGSAGPGKSLLGGQPQTGKGDDKAKENDPVLIRSAGLQYSRAANSIHYAGGVVLDSAKTRLRADSMDVFLDSEGRQVERSIARGNLVITQPGREVNGLEAEYFPAEGKFIVTGSPATITDYVKKEKRTSSAPRLTFFTADDRILLGR